MIEKKPVNKNTRIHFDVDRNGMATVETVGELGELIGIVGKMMMDWAKQSDVPVEELLTALQMGIGAEIASEESSKNEKRSREFRDILNDLFNKQ